VSRVAIFIDGAYLDFVLKAEYGSPKVDHQTLATELADGIDILRTYYYHCLPYQSASPTPLERQRFSRAQAFYAALDRLQRYQVRLGRLAFRGNDQSGRPIFQQKRVDIMLGVDLTLLSGKRQITHAFLLAGDSDFIPAVEAAKNEGVLVRLYHGVRPHKDLWDCADERFIIDQGLLDRILAKP